MTLPRSGALSTRVLQRPTTLSARAAVRLADGPLDSLTLMRDVCQVDRLQQDAAERMAMALLSSHPEFVRLPSGHWALEGWAPLTSASAACAGDPARAPDRNPGIHGETPSGLSPSCLEDIAFSVVDVETTGTSAGRGDRITEIAIAQVRHGAVYEVYTQLVNPERPIPPHISALTQITWAMVRDQPVFRHVAPDVTSRLAGTVFAAHNAAFDWRFVSEELSRTSGQQLAGPRLCTVRMARVLLPQLSRRSLDHVAHHFGIEISARHRAAGDAEATAKVLIRLLRVAGDQGLTTWPELDQLLRTPASRRGQTAADRRRRAFPLPVREDDIA